MVLKDWKKLMGKDWWQKNDGAYLLCIKKINWENYEVRFTSKYQLGSRLLKRFRFKEDALKYVKAYMRKN